MDYNYDDTSASEPTPENPNSFTPIPEVELQPIEVIPTPAIGPIVTTETSVLNTANVSTDFKAQPKTTIKPFEAIVLILIAFTLIYCGMGIKHAKKAVVKPVHKVVAVAQKETPKAVIKVTPATPAPQRGNNVSRRTRIERTDPAWKKWGPKK